MPPRADRSSPHGATHLLCGNGHHRKREEKRAGILIPCLLSHSRPTLVIVMSRRLMGIKHATAPRRCSNLVPSEISPARRYRLSYSRSALTNVNADVPSSVLARDFGLQKIWETGACQGHLSCFLAIARLFWRTCCRYFLDLACLGADDSKRRRTGSDVCVDCAAVPSSSQRFLRESFGRPSGHFLR